MDTPAHAASSPESQVADIRAAAAAEARHIATIRKLCTGQHAEIEAQAITEGWDPTRTELALLRASRPQGPYLVRGTAHDRFGPAQLLEAALALNRPFIRLERHYPADLLQAAEDRHGRRWKLREAICLVAQANGYAGSPSLEAHSLGEAMCYAGTFPLTLQAAGSSTLSLPSILSNLLNKELLDAYQEQDQTWRRIAIVCSVNDFKIVTSHRLLDNMAYKPVAPEGELKHGTVSEETYTRQIHTYGRMFALTRDKIIDDDLGAFDDIRTRLAEDIAVSFQLSIWPLPPLIVLIQCFQYCRAIKSLFG